MHYPHEDLDKKWQQKWQEAKLYAASEDTTKPKTYVLDMFPYPSGEGLHVGHPKGYIATDVYSRSKRMQGHSVLHPMGWDAFGLPAENFALKHKTHPRKAVEQNIARFKDQLAHMGFDYDWSREINTTDPTYYRWTQWIFLKLFESGLAFQSSEPINWCPSCMTGLANEDLDGDECERCGTKVEKKSLPQWVLKITDYADRMLADLDQLDWPEHIKEAQRNWIGRSAGAELDFELVQKGADTPAGERAEQTRITVFTTRADTLYGATFLVVAPEHPWLTHALNHGSHTLKNASEIRTYVSASTAKTEIERSAEGREKTGVLLEGVVAINPATKQEIPVFAADYVLATYGTGAVMGVPGHDERDLAFALRKNVPIVQVIDPIAEESQDGKAKRGEVAASVAPASKTYEPYTGRGHLQNSGAFDGRDSTEVLADIVESVGGKLVTRYKLRDWIFSRQRYWGEPIPIIHCEKDGAVAVPYEDLPVLLPEVESYEPTGTGESPLAAIDEWVNTVCPKCGGPGKRETNTMPQWAGSSWYYLRFMDPHDDTQLVSTEKEKYWAPVDVYVGGDHAVRHLIYARFWHKFLYDIGVVSTKEPFARLEFLGFILAEDGRKMSKRLGNVINPDDVVAQYGADAFRLYEMFMGPFENTIAWSTAAITGTARFVDRVWTLSDSVVSDDVPALTTILHQTIQKVTDDIESFKFNTAVSQMMIFLNAAEKERSVGEHQWKMFVQLLAPFAPHVSEALWEKLGELQSVHVSQWPLYDAAKLVTSVASVVVQVAGKRRGELQLSVTAPQEEALSEALKLPPVANALKGKTPQRIVYVPGKILNIVP